nr:ribonuclease H-like domain-containing protein [Tanacetum cinerariifolium]
MNESPILKRLRSETIVKLITFNDNIWAVQGDDDALLFYGMGGLGSLSVRMLLSPVLSCNPRFRMITHIYRVCICFLYFPGGGLFWLTKKIPEVDLSIFKVSYFVASVLGCDEYLAMGIKNKILRILAGQVAILAAIADISLFSDPCLSEPLNAFCQEWNLTLESIKHDLYFTFNKRLYDDVKQILAKSNENCVTISNVVDRVEDLDTHKNFLQQPMTNPEDITDPTTALNMALALMAKAFKLNYSTPTNNNQRISSNPRNRQIAQPGMNMGQDRQMQMIGAEEYDLMVAATDLDEIKEVNTNCILMANLQQASSSGTQSDSAPVYDFDGSAEVHEYENCYNNEIFNMFTQEEQYTKLLEPIPESHQVPQNDNEDISKVTGVEQGGETVEQHSENFEETRALFSYS